ncbi:MAG: molecular chaperone [Sphaerochaetaceae bacterium]|nr:molecular chaperone [Sphaerochaetaceae bacterium]
MSKKLFLAFVLIVAVVFSVAAFQFSPLESTFEPTGANSSKIYTIVNDSDDSIAIQVSVLKRDQDAQGNEINEDGSAFFSVDRPYLIVPAQSSALVRITYQGTKTVTSEMAFRVRAEQIAYSQGKAASNQSMFNFLYVYSTSAYVSPAEKVKKVDVGNIKASYDEEGNQVLQVTVRNRGNVHQILMDAKLEIKDGTGKSVTISGPEALLSLDSMNLLAKKQVTKVIPFPEGLTFREGATYTGSLSYTE